MTSKGDLVIGNFNGQNVTIADVLYQLLINNEIGGLDDAFERIFITHLAQQHKLTVSDEELQTDLDSFRRSGGLLNQRAFEEWLRVRFLTLDDIERRLTTGLLREKLKNEVIPSQRVEQYFERNRRSFEWVEISQVATLRSDDAKAIVAGLRQNQKGFKKLALPHQNNPETQDATGYIGRMSRNQIRPELAPDIFSAKPGQVVGPIKLGKYFFIVLVHQRGESQLTPEVHDMIAEMLFEQWLEAEARRAKIEYVLPQKIKEAWNATHTN